MDAGLPARAVVLCHLFLLLLFCVLLHFFLCLTKRLDGAEVRLFPGGPLAVPHCIAVLGCSDLLYSLRPHWRAYFVQDGPAPPLLIGEAHRCPLAHPWSYWLKTCLGRPFSPAIDTVRVCAGLRMEFRIRRRRPREPRPLLARAARIHPGPSAPWFGTSRPWPDAATPGWLLLARWCARRWRFCRPFSRPCLAMSLFPGSPPP